VPHPSDDDLALLALGEPAPDVAAHVRDCPVCDVELRALRATARRTDMIELADPPPAVWQRIADELGLADELPTARPDDVVVLDDSGLGRLTVPEGVRPGDYPEVDVSLEPDDGDPAHSGDSVLRGELPA
jgi:hypothetical protein